MSNSNLVDVVIESPNCNSPRNNQIKKITIHHMAAVWTVERCGECFADSSRQASSNYGIDSDGRVGLYVSEENRAWTSGNAENDNQAVTIEVSNCETGGDWAVSDKAYAKLIDLCVDICQRNGIERLNYTGDTSGNLTIHKMFQATACPGPYLEARMLDIANQVNKRLGVEIDEEVPENDVYIKSDNVALEINNIKTDNIDVEYQVQLKEDGRWLSVVRNLTDYAGIVGKEMIGIAIKVSKGYATYRVHDVDGWHGLIDTRNTNINDFQNGYAGNNKPIDALEVYYYTPEDIVQESGYKKAVYHVSPVNGEYFDWQHDNETSNNQDGYAGVFGMPIDRVQIVIE